MDSKYKAIKQLIDFWALYEDEEKGEQTLLNFSQWIIDQIEREKISDTKIRTRNENKSRSESLDYLNRLDPLSRFQEHILRIARLEEFYLRKYLVDLPLNSRLEYLFLFTVDSLEKAKKTDLINIHLVEYTTGMDTIRRLIKNKLLYELPDVQDKRAKLLVLTKEGDGVLKRANRRMDEARDKFLLCISPNKWKKALPVLNEIDAFHSEIYLNHYDKPFSEISNLMDSLKHLNK